MTFYNADSMRSLEDIKNSRYFEMRPRGLAQGEFSQVYSSRVPQSSDDYLNFRPGKKHVDVLYSVRSKESCRKSTPQAGARNPILQGEASASTQQRVSRPIEPSPSVSLQYENSRKHLLPSEMGIKKNVP